MFTVLIIPAWLSIFLGLILKGKAPKLHIVACFAISFGITFAVLLMFIAYVEYSLHHLFDR